MTLWVCCFVCRLWCWESNWWCEGVHFVVRDGFISDIFNISAKSQIYQRTRDVNRVSTAADEPQYHF